jgi:hypothetical protein
MDDLLAKTEAEEAVVVVIAVSNELDVGRRGLRV